jgi:hypothetical protein
VLSAVGWPCGGLQAPNEDQSDEESDWSPRVTLRPACFRIEKNLRNSTQLMLHELPISPVVSARVADVALLTAY